MAGQNEPLVEHLFRTEYGRLVAVLTGLFGPSYIELAEDVVQETLIAALDTWGVQGVPANPTGWLVQVAKRKALNELKRKQMVQRHHQSGALSNEQQTGNGDVFLENEIKDSQLRMIFTCCHSALNIESQIALTLKTLCGFGVKEVARALLTTEATINKRLYRAKKKIRESDHPFTIPQGKELESKLGAVGITLYLLFNEGYNSSGGDSLIQKELCLEAVRLSKLLVDQFPEAHSLQALLALMCFHTARFEARIDDHGAIILFEDQDRDKWNQELIQIGLRFFQQSLQAKELSAYHIEARIAAEHCTAKSFDETNWQTLYDQYVLLEKLKPNPVIKLNLAIIQSRLKGLEYSLNLLHELNQSEELKHYPLLPATQGVFLKKLNRFDEARVYLKAALDLHPSEAERDLIQKHLEDSVE